MVAILAVQTLFMALCAHVYHLADDGQKLRCGGAGGGSLRVWHRGHPDGYRQYAGDAERFGPSHMAFLVRPRWSGRLTIDIVNALVIKLYLMLPMFA